MQQTNQILLTKAKETLFITLYAKALDSRSTRSILHDITADAIVQQMNYDFNKLPGFANNNIIVVRARQYDEWLKEYLDWHPNAVVLNLGCGLDTRIARINPPVNIRWFDLDYPEVIQLRQRFFENKNGYTMIASSVTGLSWMKQLPTDRPAIIIAEGLLEYLTEDEVRILLNRLTTFFPHGQLIFDVMSSFAIRSGRKKLMATTGAVHKWAVDNLEEVDQLDLRSTRISGLSVFQSPFIKKLPLGYRFLYGAMGKIPPLNNMLRLLRYEF